MRPLPDPFMRILLISQYFWPENFPINSAVTDLCRRGHDVTVVTALPNTPGGKLFASHSHLRFATVIRDLFSGNRETYPGFSGVRIIRLPIILRGAATNLQLIVNYLSFLVSALAWSAFFCRKNDYDIVMFSYSPLTEGIPALFLKFFKGLPTVFWVQDPWPESLQATKAVSLKAALSLVGSYIGFLYRHTSTILVQSPGYTPLIKKLSPKSRIVFVPNSADSYYRPVTREEGLRHLSEKKGLLLAQPDSFTLMFAGNLGASQNFGTLIEAARLLRERGFRRARWIVIGDGRMRPWIEDKIRREDLEDSFSLLGQFPPEDMPYFFACADALVISLLDSYVFSLTIPSKTQSYLACGKPVIAALKGEGARIIREAGAGLVVDPASATELADAVTQLAGLSEDKLKEHGASGRKYFENNFEKSIVFGKLEKALVETALKH